MKGGKVQAEEVTEHHSENYREQVVLCAWGRSFRGVKMWETYRKAGIEKIMKNIKGSGFKKKKRKKAGLW